ncbi:Sec-independent protein translocase protein TatB [Chromobacterium alticapitis]|uniref:Sec-independent protein translocase protein TatB n=1 Tax=Chromobacterium alticapitis TaxID=2073169 RepID=A0A2S5DLQ0_9NEIS|nr:Sec-independent protein translocase protein TatB [Chromobacterium alticapitis]POZ63973.1 twin-arginine translocase subunit TatB [Chromobacterium alticapitis]
MLDISFGEFVLIGVVALVVLGPERLPAVARTVGALLARAQRFVATVKADIQHQANLQGLDDIRQDLQDAAHSFRGQLEAEVQQVRDAIDQNAAEARALAEQAAEPFHEAERTIHGGSAPEAEAQVPGETTDPVSPEAPAETPPRDENQLDLFAHMPEHRPAPQIATPPQAHQ